MEIVEKGEFLLTSGERMGADLSEPSRTLEEAIVATKEKDYSQAMDLADRSRDLAEAASLGAALRDGNTAMDNGRYSDMIGIRERTRKDVVAATENLFNLVKQKVVQVKNLKINIDEMRDILKRAKTSLSVEDHLEAIRFMQEANEKANRILDLYRATHHAISSSAALVAEAKKRDVDVTKVLEILLEAKRAFERLEF